MTKNNAATGAFSDHPGCPGGAIETMAFGRGGGAYKSAAVEGTRGTAGIQRSTLGSLGPVLRLVTE